MPTITPTVPTPRQLELPSELALALFEAAAMAARAVARRLRRPPPRRGATLPPGIDTPLWNELVRQAQPFLRKRGSKAQLARLLGLPRQRMQVCLKAQSGCLDAERTLMLLCWVAARQQGRDGFTP